MGRKQVTKKTHKLTSSQVDRIVNYYFERNWSAQRIADKFNISTSTVYYHTNNQAV